VIRRLERTRLRFEDMLTSKRVPKRDVELVYEGLFLRAVVEFEDLLELRFFEILNGRLHGGKMRIKPKVSAKTASVMRDIVHGGNDFVKWLPFKETETRAKRFLRGGRPFSLLNDDDRSKLARILFIRNAIAHSSDSARQSFLDKVIGGTHLLPQEKNPAGFLRSVFRTSPTLRRLQVYLDALRVICSKLDRSR